MQLLHTGCISNYPALDQLGLCTQGRRSAARTVRLKRFALPSKLLLRDQSSCSICAYDTVGTKARVKLSCYGHLK